MESPTSLWLVTTGEPLPSDGPGTRLLRTGLFFEDAVARGLAVNWWTSGFDHARRRQRSRTASREDFAPSGRITLVPSPGYNASVSPRRLWDHVVTARRFRRLAEQVPAPDLVWCSFPTIELAGAAVEYGRARKVPVVLDIRDLWPDVLWDSTVPWRSGPVRTLALAPLRRSAARAIRGAAAVVGLTDEYVDWAMRLAGRERGPWDVAIPVTCPDPEVPVAGQRADAERFWREQGVDPSRHWIVCFLGTLGRQFDFAPVLEAAADLAGRAPEVRFVICGVGEGLKPLRAQAAGLANVVLPGWVDGGPRRLLLSVARAGLGPYRPLDNFVRNLPNKPVEYFAHGLPVLYPLDGVLHRICAGAGAGIRYGGAGPHLASVIEELRADPAHLADLSAAALRLHRERFRREVVTERMLSVCLEVTGRA